MRPGFCIMLAIINAFTAYFWYRAEDFTAVGIYVFLTILCLVMASDKEQTKEISQ